MFITVTIAEAVTQKLFEQTEALARRLQLRDCNFKYRSISVHRGDITSVSDVDDPMRGALLLLLVISVLRERT